MRWHRLAVLVGLVLMTAGLAGCLGGGDDGGGDAIEPGTTDGDEDPDGVDETVAAGPRIVNESHEGTTQGAQVPVAGTFCLGSCENTLPFSVASNATAIVVELAWEGGDNLILDLVHPVGETCEPVVPGVLVDCRQAEANGASPLRIELTDQETLSTTGEWTARAWAEASPQAAVPFAMYVSVVYDGALPEGLSQLEG